MADLKKALLSKLTGETSLENALVKNGGSANTSRPGSHIEINRNASVYVGSYFLMRGRLYSTWEEFKCSDEYGHLARREWR